LKFYKAKKKVTDDKVYYGDLPYQFVIGYENDEYAYFELLDEVQLPSKKNKDIEKITESEYREFISILTQREAEKRLQEEQTIMTQLKAKENGKKQNEEKLKRQFNLLLNLLKSKKLLTEIECNQILNLE
jgi:hypothetical protein